MTNHMLTSKDIDKLIQVFATKAELKEGLYKLEERFNIKFQSVLDKLDAVYKELKDMRLEQNMHIQKHRDIDERLDKLESISSIL